MAEALLRASYGDRYEAYSAGTQPASVNPYAVRVMAELNIDLSGHEAKSVDLFTGLDFDYVVTVCDHAREACPFFAGAKELLHESFEDPAETTGSEERILNTFVRVRDELKSWIDRTFGKELEAESA